MQRGSYTSFPFPSASSIPCRERKFKLQGDGMIDRYSPHPLRAPLSGGSPPNASLATPLIPTDSSSFPMNTYTPTRRKTGALASNVSLGAQQYTASKTTSPSTLMSTELFNEQRHLFPKSSATPPAPMQTTLHHSASVAAPAASSVLAELSSPLRSGSSTTLPSTGLSNPLGSSSFSSSQLTSSNHNTVFPIWGELRSGSGMDSGAYGVGVHTLDRLGLDEAHHRPPPATIMRRATVSAEQPVYELSSSFNTTNAAQLSQTGILKTDKSSTLRSGALPSVRFPVTEVSGSRTPSNLLTPNQPGWAVWLNTESVTQILTSTRSLRIENLDSSVTGEQLIRVFAPYGAIESLWLHPGKVRHRHKPGCLYNRFLIKFRTSGS